MTIYRAETHLTDLTDFQRRSVDHVFNQFYGPVDAQRFLVADETGLGKTRVAQGVIARAIEYLQTDDRVNRIDVVYVCSNADLARQNIKRLNVTGQSEIPFSSRLTMLGMHSKKLKGRPDASGKPVNLVSFTPGTSFDMGNSLGMAQERSMILLALDEILLFEAWPWRTAMLLLKGQVGSVERFDSITAGVQTEIGDDGIDPTILRAFKKAIQAGGTSSLLNRFQALSAEVGRKRSLSPEQYDESVALVRGFRSALARASVQTLEPDLVILDEFQRFRHLLQDDTPAGELAHNLFEYEAAKVLLLSATPYKPFTYSEERDEDHASDLFATLGFLAKGRTDVNVEDIRTGLHQYRELVLGQDDNPSTIDDLQSNLLKLMSRAERPILPEGSMLVERRQTATDVRADDLVGYARLDGVAKVVAHERDHNLLTPEYWKSAPYFINFCDGYQLGARIDSADQSDELDVAIHQAQRIDGARLRDFTALEPGNARMRSLTDDTLENNWWRLLWVPPSLPYLAPAAPYDDPAIQGMTKRLVFSSWTATPTAVASVLSYEAERRAAEGSEYTEYTPEGRNRIARHLGYDLRDGRAARMATVLLHWPMSQLAQAADPLQLLANNAGQAVTADQARALTGAAISSLWDSGPKSSHSGSTTSTELNEDVWRAALSLPGNWPEDARQPRSDSEIASALIGTTPESEEDQDAKEPTGVARHVELARQALNDPAPTIDEATLATLADIALFSPANISLRALSRIGPVGDGVSAWGLFKAAAHLANGLRSLFQRPANIKLLESLSPAGPGAPFWRQVLAYIAAGNLEAVLDEYLHHLAAEEQGKPIDDELLLTIAIEAASALSLRGATYRAKDPTKPKATLPIAPRFALRYGGRQQDAEDVRQPEVRRSFNSPFWPLVLASTSVGQEGIDFHWWCHAVFHWNTPANPVDFEQRQGRVDRYRGHAVRKNVAAAHGTSVLGAYEPGNPWDRLFATANEHRAEYGDFTPGWVYPGDAKIESHVNPFVLSSDESKYDRMKRDVALYRFTFGQPRQEDLLELLRGRTDGAPHDALSNLRLDLSPPR